MDKATFAAITLLNRVGDIRTADLLLHELDCATAEFRSFGWFARIFPSYCAAKQRLLQQVRMASQWHEHGKATDEQRKKLDASLKVAEDLLQSRGVK